MTPMLHVRFFVFPLVLLLGLLAPAAWAQTATLFGVVSDATDGLPLAGANVILTSDGTTMVDGTASNIDGNYRMEGIQPGSYVLVVRFVGYREVAIPVTLSAGQTEQIDFELGQIGFDLDAVVVTASRQAEKVLDAPASISVLSAREVQQDVAPSSVEALRNTTGVDMAQTGVDRREVVLRGFNNAFSGATYVLTDYRQSAVPSLGVNIYSLMPGMTIDIERVEVVRGPGSALYGAGVDAGVVHFITQDPFTSPGTALSLIGGERSMFGGQIRHAGVINDRFGYKITGAYTQADDWELDPDDPEDAEQLDTDLIPRNNDFQKLNLNGLVQYRVSPRTTVTADGGFSALTATVLSGVGTVQADGFGYSYGQVRLQSGALFAQVYFNKNNAGDSFVYATDLDGDGVPDPVVDNSVQTNAQVQYDFAFNEGRQRFIVGADFENTASDTDGTIHGRNEDENTITEYGVYGQGAIELTPELELTLALRGDYNNIFETFQLSPRAAAVYKLGLAHSVRATYNRAFSSPGSNSLFLDIVGQTQNFGGGRRLIFQGRGSFEGFTFDDYRANNTIRFFLPVDGFFRQDFAADAVPLLPIFLATAGGLPTADPADLGPLGDLTPQQLGALAQALVGLAGQIQGTTGVVLGFPAGEGLRFVDGPEDIDPLEQTTSQVFEVGYKGLFAERMLFAVDGYYVTKENFVGPLTLESPIAVAATAGGQLRNQLAGLVTQDMLDQLGLGITVEQLFTVFSGLASRPVGVVQPDQELTDDPNTVAGFLAYRNYGDLTYWGLDASAQFIVNDNIDLFGNVSVVSDDFFDPEELDEEGTDLTLALNASTLKVKFGGSYRKPGSFNVNASGRYTEGFPVVSGPYIGDLESYFLLDVGAGYDFARTLPGLRFDVTVQNVLDNEHREFIGAPLLGRMAMARLTYSL